MRVLIIFLSLGMILVMYPQAVSAHTKLQASIPEQGEIITNPLHEIVLEFNTEIKALSSFKLKDELGNEVGIEEQVVLGSVMTGKVTETISNGSYVMEWRIVGEDGHPIEGEFNFSIDYEVNSDELNVSNEVQQPFEEHEVPVEPHAVAPTSIPQTEGQFTVSNADSSQSLPARNGVWIIIGIAIIALLFITVELRRKKS